MQSHVNFLLARLHSIAFGEGAGEKILLQSVLLQSAFRHFAQIEEKLSLVPSSVDFTFVKSYLLICEAPPKTQGKWKIAMKSPTVL